MKGVNSISKKMQMVRAELTTTRLCSPCC